MEKWVAAWFILGMGCAPTTQLRILMAIPESQRDQYHANVIRPFEKKNKCQVYLDTYTSVEILLERLKQAPDSLQPDLVELPYEVSENLAQSGLLRPLRTRLDAEALQTLKQDFFFAEQGWINGQLWFWPHHIETPLLLYLKSHVTQASRFWDLRQAEIERSLNLSGLGDLPPDYQLENDPQLWDQLDLFVAASFWKQQERKGRRRARISLGLGSPHEVTLSLMNRCVQLGAASQELQSLEATAVQAGLRWQQAFVQQGLLRPGSYRGEVLDSLGQAFEAGEVYLAEVTSRQAFRIHGNGTAKLPGYLVDPDDMGISPLPTGGLAGQKDARRGVLTRLWFWGLGHGQGDTAKVGALLKHLTATSSLVFEAANFGLIPARRDVISELPLIYGGGWAGDIYQAAAQQLIANGTTQSPFFEPSDPLGQKWNQASQEISNPFKPKNPVSVSGKP